MKQKQNWTASWETLGAVRKNSILSRIAPRKQRFVGAHIYAHVHAHKMYNNAYIGNVIVFFSFLPALVSFLFILFL